MHSAAANLLLLLFGAHLQAVSQFRNYSDATWQSKTFGELRHYRIFLPTGYQASSRRYPVIYYFHGHSDRYTLEAYDKGLDTVPKIAAFVASHPVIVVAPDGYVARDYQAFYKGTPYDVRRDGGEFDFGAGFVELVRYIDKHCRTLTSRQFRATSGLSMGGFMSFYLSARYPNLVGSASAFNPGPEFYVGEKGRRSLWRPKDHVLAHEHTKIRLIRASGDYISQYHEETRAAYATSPTVQFEFRQDEYHRHWATSIAETFAFHMRAFADSTLTGEPDHWNYSSAFHTFDVHDYHIRVGGEGASLTYLENVSAAGFQVSTRKWAPDGPTASCGELTVLTAPVYRPGSTYKIVDLDLSSSHVSRSNMTARPDGRLAIQSDCSGHNIGINGASIKSSSPALLPLTNGDVLRVPSSEVVSLPIRLFNPASNAVTITELSLTSDYPTVEVLPTHAISQTIGAATFVDFTPDMRVRFTAGDNNFEHARLYLKFTAEDEVHSKSIDVLVMPESLPPATDVEVLDGRTMTFSVFRQRGNQGGGGSVMRTVTEGSGNGDGILQAGEQATIWVKVRQGLDAFDKGNWRRAKVYSESALLTEVADIQEDKQLEWTGAQNRTSLMQLSSDAPPGATIPLILDCEGWSFDFTPDVLYGREPLYQAFQRHSHQLFSWTWRDRK